MSELSASDLVIAIESAQQDGAAQVGGKGAHLGELTQIKSIRVPPGFCVTTDAFSAVLSEIPGLEDRLDTLDDLCLSGPGGAGAEEVRRLTAEIRALIEGASLPGDLVTQVRGELGRLGEHAAYAVRSSATAEDLPTASFAGQHESYLDVTGEEAVLGAIQRCWASLFNERAVAYRRQHDVDHRAVRMAVVVQQMVPADAAGVLFTADPATGHRAVTVIEAVPGLGEALVSGQVTPDNYTVREDVIEARAVGQGVLTDPQIQELVVLGRRIEAHFGRPQDIEWCLADGDLWVVQSRPITTLFPVPEAADGDLHVYVSVGHQQMMTDPMKPLGLSVWQHTSPAPMVVAGGRLFVDATEQLTSPARDAVIEALGRSDPRIADALQVIVDRGDLPTPEAPEVAEPPAAPPPAPPQLPTDPAIVAELVEGHQATIAELHHGIQGLSGTELFDFLEEDLPLRRLMSDPRSLQAINAGMEATWWLNEHLHDWLGEENAADTLAQSAPHNVTAQMGFALLDVADAIRPHPEVVAFLRHTDSDEFVEALPALPGGRRAGEAIGTFLEAYGMRCVGEIDITRPRWIERPTALLPVLLGHVDNASPGEGVRRFERGRQQAQAYAADLLTRLRELPDGETKATRTREMIERLRTFVGYREFPKYAMVTRYLAYKKALLGEAERLVNAGLLEQGSDIFWLTLAELREAVETQEVSRELIARRAEEFESYAVLTPPRVMTSDGEMVTANTRHDDAPAGALLGLPASAGTVEGRARILSDLTEADFEAEDILVTAFTDPSWTSVFVSIRALVTEAGGMMTHGAVVAREYGLPAVVGVDRATSLIQDGQRIRVNGTSGTVEILS